MINTPLLIGFSADAYIQMALQIAWYRTTGEFTATYETALTRMFNKGRTETIRTLSVESRAFVLAMTDNDNSISVSRFSAFTRYFLNIVLPFHPERNKMGSTPTRRSEAHFSYTRCRYWAGNRPTSSGSTEYASTRRAKRTLR